ncbi:hypothetical protein SAMN04488121_10675 [Chitinophaga filiformis]|uniref:Uncharacterized protein n=1 Tax=Chitinophaga filiformis TaxID=104663 RepID=A0A1G7WN73_CHIFI|nr:hypothetical protein SAMN04488121_10675 [Chitinophaga filiformis]
MQKTKYVSFVEMDKMRPQREKNVKHRTNNQLSGGYFAKCLLYNKLTLR